jgi:polyferredoxin
MQEQGNGKEQKETSVDESFRDTIATINEEGKRNWIYPKKPKGKFYTARGITSIVYLILLFGLPFVKVNGEPLILLNVLERKFILFGVIFWPQDFILFGLGMLTFLGFIVLFTVAFGRLFC